MWLGVLQRCLWGAYPAFTRNRRLSQYGNEHAVAVLKDNEIVDHLRTIFRLAYIRNYASYKFLHFFSFRAHHSRIIRVSMTSNCYAAGLRHLFGHLHSVNAVYAFLFDAIAAAIIATWI